MSPEALLKPIEQTAAVVPFSPQNFWPKDWEQGLRYAQLLAKAPSMLPKHIRESKSPAEEIFATIMFGFEVGLAPLQALRAIYIVHGRAGMYAADQIALVQRHPDCEKLEVLHTDAKSCTWATKRRGRGEQQLTLTMAECEQEGLVAGNAKYKTAPAVMLRWRCATRLLSFTWGDVLRGLEDREHVETEEKDGGTLSRVGSPMAVTAPPAFLQVTPANQAPAPTVEAFPTQNDEAPPAAVEPEAVDELSFAFLAKYIEASSSKLDLQARSVRVQQAKAAKRLTPDEEGQLLGIYKVKRDSFNGGAK